MPLRTSRTRLYLLAAGQVLVALGTAVVLPLIFFQSDAASRAFPTYSRIIISILAGMVVLLTPVPTLLAQSLLEQRQMARRVVSEQQRSARVELMKGDLLRIQSALGHASTIDHSNLFVTLIGQEVGDLADRVEECARKQTLDFRPTYKTTDPFFDGLSADTELQLFHYADNHDWVLEVGGHSLGIQDNLAQRIARGRLASVSRIIILGNAAEAADIRTWIYCLFHRDASNYAYHVVSKATFDRIRMDTGVRDQRVDVGIYGRSYLYISQQSPTATDVQDRMAPRGTISANETAIDTYRRLFREAFDAGRELPLPVLELLSERLGKLDSVTKLTAALEAMHLLLPMRELVQDNEQARTEFETFIGRYSGPPVGRRGLGG